MDFVDNEIWNPVGFTKDRRLSSSTDELLSMSWSSIFSFQIILFSLRVSMGND